jgi:putative transcriptional regulator
MSKKAFERIMEGLDEALAHAKGAETPGLIIHLPETVNVTAIRKKTGLSQTAFAGKIGVPVATLRNWEQRRRAPEGPARVLLALLDRDPKIVEKILGHAA